MILIVEDDAEVATLLVEALAELRHDVQLAETAGEAVAMAGMHRPDVVLLDITLPDASGTTTFDRLRVVLPDVPIIMVTGNADERLARETLRRGAFDYVMKPFNVDHLTRVIEAALAT